MIWEIDLVNGKGELIITLEELKKFSFRKEMKDAKHKINHIMYSPSGKYFVFMHRWITSKGKFSRLYLGDSVTKKLKILLDNRMVSHYCCKDDKNMLLFGRTKEYGDNYYLIYLN